MQSYLSYSSKTYRLYVDFLFIGLLLLVVSCNCRNTPLNQRGTKNNNSEETNPTRAHLVLSSDKSNLENEQINFIVFVKNEGASMANLPDYHWKINLQEEGGTGSTLAYMDANNTLQPILSSQQPFPNFLQQEALKKSDPTLGIPFQLQPAPDVKKITITLVLEHQRNEDQVSPLIISWHSLVPITDAMIQLARSKGFTSLADTLSKLQRREEKRSNKCECSY